MRTGTAIPQRTMREKWSQYLRVREARSKEEGGLSRCMAAGSSTASQRPGLPATQFWGY